MIDLFVIEKSNKVHAEWRITADDNSKLIEGLLDKAEIIRKIKRKIYLKTVLIFFLDYGA